MLKGQEPKLPWDILDPFITIYLNFDVWLNILITNREASQNVSRSLADLYTPPTLKRRCCDIWNPRKTFSCLAVDCLPDATTNSLAYIDLWLCYCCCVTTKVQVAPSVVGYIIQGNLNLCSCVKYESLILDSEYVVILYQQSLKALAVARWERTPQGQVSLEGLEPSLLFWADI